MSWEFRNWSGSFGNDPWLDHLADSPISTLAIIVGAIFERLFGPFESQPEELDASDLEHFHAGYCGF